VWLKGCTRLFIHFLGKLKIFLTHMFTLLMIFWDVVLLSLRIWQTAVLTEYWCVQSKSEHIQWNLDLSFPQQSFSCMYRSPFLSWMKFHINNVIYSRIHRSPNYHFTALIVCKSPPQHFQQGSFEKKIKAK